MPDAVLSLDLGGTKLASALVDRRGRLSEERVEPTDLSSAEKLLEQVKRSARRLASRAVSAGVSVPGLARPDGTVWAPNLPGWTRLPLRRELQRALRLPVAVESDRNCAVLGEVWRGAARGHSDVVCLIVGTGIGAGILAGGRVIRGADELSGCAGWLAVTDQLRDEYRRSGALESLAAGPAIARFAGAKNAAQAVEAARAGDPRARCALERAAFHLGLGVANIISLFNPRVVVLGGGVAAAGEMLLRPLRRAALAWTQPLAARRVRIVRSRLGARALLLGAAWMAWRLVPEESKRT